MIVLDTHALVWMDRNDSKLGPQRLAPQSTARRGYRHKTGQSADLQTPGETNRRAPCDRYKLTNLL